MICSVCGKSTIFDFFECPKCGASLAGPELASVSSNSDSVKAAAPNVPSAVAKPKGKKGSIKPFHWILLIVTGIIMLHIFDYMLIFSAVPALILFVSISLLSPSKARKVILPALSVQFGQGAYLLAALFWARSFMPLGPDLIILALLLLWLYFKPNVLSISFLLVYQIASAGLNVIQYFQWQEALVKKAIVLHIIFRLTGIFLLAYALSGLDKLTWRNSSRNALAPDAMAEIGQEGERRA